MCCGAGCGVADCDAGAGFEGCDCAAGEVVDGHSSLSCGEARWVAEGVDCTLLVIVVSSKGKRQWHEAGSGVPAMQYEARKTQERLLTSIICPVHCLEEEYGSPVIREVPRRGTGRACFCGRKILVHCYIERISPNNLVEIRRPQNPRIDQTVDQHHVSTRLPLPNRSSLTGLDARRQAVSMRSGVLR